MGGAPFLRAPSSHLSKNRDHGSDQRKRETAHSAPPGKGSWSGLELGEEGTGERRSSE